MIISTLALYFSLGQPVAVQATCLTDLSRGSLSMTSMRELKTEKEKVDWLGKVFAVVPSMANYYDLSVILSSAEWSAYRVFATQDASGHLGFGGLSPTGNFNVYSDSFALTKDLLRELHRANGGKSPRLILGPLQNREAVREIPELETKVTGDWKYELLTAETAGSKAPVNDQYIFRRAEPTPADQKLVQEWFTKFNAEMKDNWPVPSLEDLGKQKLYFLIDRNSGELVAAAANPLPDAERFWAGRIYVAESQRKKGLGKIIVKHLFALADADGRSIAEQVVTTNTASLAMSASLGFSLRGTNVGIRF